MTAVAGGGKYANEAVAVLAYRPVFSDRGNDRDGFPYVDSANPATWTASDCDTTERVNGYTAQTECELLRIISVLFSSARQSETKSIVEQVSGVDDDLRCHSF